jgi:Fe-S oxidoreductase
MEEEMVSKSYIDAFNPDGKDEKFCETCGICLQRCPVMHMDKEDSWAEMSRLLRGEETERVLNECTLCFSCNRYCPHGLKPYALLMERMVEKNRKSGKGIPPFVNYLFTGKTDSCLFWDIYESESEEERAILDRWQIVPPKAQEMLFIGCVGRTIPYGIEHSGVFQSLPKYAPRDACCGELSYRYGDYETFSKTVERTYQQLKALDTERLVCYCGSCANYLGNIWPDYHGVHLPFEIISVWEWLWEKLEKGELKVQRKISKRIALTDSCYSSELGDRFFQAMRGLHEAVGMEVVELDNNRYDNLTCGSMSVIRNNYDLMEGMKETGKKMEQVLKTNVGDLSCYCPGCYTQLRGAAKNSGINIHYSLEEILWALGDEYPVPYEERAAQQTKLFIQKLKSKNTG